MMSLSSLKRKSRLVPSDLEKLYVRSASNNLVQLNNLVSYKETAGPNSISHYNRTRSTTIEATPLGVPLGTAVSRVNKMLQKELSKGFKYEWSGEAKDLKEASQDALFVGILAVVIVYMVLAAQFESLVDPFVILLTVPLAGIGAFGSLWLLSWVNALGMGMYGWAHYAPDPPVIASILSAIVPRIPAMTINLFSLVGLVLLLGLVTKNAILLVEFANQKQQQGLSPREAMFEAARIRFRPILMTAFSTIFGILPIAIGFGAGAESRRPMGVVVVFGMMISTILTLFVIPVIYTIIAELKAKKDDEQIY